MAHLLLTLLAVLEVLEPTNISDELVNDGLKLPTSSREVLFLWVVPNRVSCANLSRFLRSSTAPNFKIEL